MASGQSIVMINLKKWLAKAASGWLGAMDLLFPQLVRQSARRVVEKVIPLGYEDEGGFHTGSEDPLEY
jgi:hypothetical protein